VELNVSKYVLAELINQTERNMSAVCQGLKSKNDMIVEAVEQYKDMYVRAKTNFAKVISVMIVFNS
jgi:DNA topoisomerase III